jgi:hypothetical protein
MVAAAWCMWPEQCSLLHAPTSSSTAIRYTVGLHDAFATWLIQAGIPVTTVFVGVHVLAGIPCAHWRGSGPAGIMQPAQQLPGQWRHRFPGGAAAMLPYDSISCTCMHAQPRLQHRRQAVTPAPLLVCVAAAFCGPATV